jgi:hypothetical protein
MAEQDDGNVVEFRRREPSDAERLELLSRAPAPSCRHARKHLIDEKQRTVQCGECGAWLEPVWCLLRLVEYRERLEYERQALERERKRLEERRQAAIARREREGTKRRAEVTPHRQRAHGAALMANQLTEELAVTFDLKPGAERALVIRAAKALGFAVTQREGDTSLRRHVAAVLVACATTACPPTVWGGGRAARTSG